MSKQALKTTLGALLVPLTLTAGCGDSKTTGEVAQDNPHIALTSIELISQDELYLLHPIHVAVKAELTGEAYKTDLVIGLRTVGGEEGCNLKAMVVNHEGGKASYSNDVEFVIDRTCYELVGRDDVELFAAFDPWNNLGDREAPNDEDGPAKNPSVFSIMSEAALSVEGCETCETTYTVHQNPGLDAELLSLDISSTVAVIPVAGDSRVEPIDKPRIDFNVSSLARVKGLDLDKGLPDGQVRLRHTIRPLGSSDAGMPLAQLRGDQMSDSFVVPVPGQSDLVVLSALSIEDETRDLIVNGSWSDVDEFELVTCLETEFDQAVYLGEDEPRANDCGALPVVVVREVVGADGYPVPQAGAASTNNANVWAAGYSAPSATGIPPSSASLQMWVQMSSTDTPTTTYKGIDVDSAGSWFEAGIYSEGSIFGYALTLADIYATFIGYEFGGAGVAMGATVAYYELIPPFEIQMQEGIPLSMADILFEAGFAINTTWYQIIPIPEITYTDGCGHMTAGIWLDAIVEIDQALTTVMARRTTQGVEVEAVINPDVQIEVRGGAEFDYDIVSGGLEIQLDVVRVDVPFTASVEVIDYDPNDAIRLQFEESAVGYISTLAGSIWYEVGYNFFGFTGSHSEDLASWNGIVSPSYQLFVFDQALQFGSDKPSGSWCSAGDTKMLSGDFDGDDVLDYMCWRPSDGYRWYDLGGDGYNGTEWNHTTFCAGSELIVGDFNGDGRDDLLCHASGQQRIALADSSGDHVGIASTLSAAWCDGSLDDPATRMMRVADVNGDNLDDWYCYNYALSQYKVNYNSGDPNYFDAITNWTGTILGNAKIKGLWASNVCLDVAGANSTTNATNVQIWNCDYVTETWDFNFLDGKIRANWASNICLDVWGTNATANGTNVGIYDCDSVTETWYLDSGDNKIHAQWDHGICLDVLHYNYTTNGTNVQIWECDQVTETWTFVEQ